MLYNYRITPWLGASKVIIRVKEWREKESCPPLLPKTSFKNNGTPYLDRFLDSRWHMAHVWDRSFILGTKVARKG